MVILSKPYKVAPGKYLGAIAIAWIGRLWWLLLIPIGLFIAGAFDWRWAAVGLIVLMLLYPMALTTVLISYALSPEVIRRAACRRAELSDTHITLFNAVENEDGSITYRSVEFLQIVEILYRGRMTKIVVGKQLTDFILIPTESLSDVGT